MAEGEGVQRFWAPPDCCTTYTYLNALGSPRSTNQSKFSEAPMPPKLPLPRGWKRRVRKPVRESVSVLNLLLILSRGVSLAAIRALH